jgi:hypothetical protein
VVKRVLNGIFFFREAILLSNINIRLILIHFERKEESSQSKIATQSMFSSDFSSNPISTTTATFDVNNDSVIVSSNANIDLSQTLSSPLKFAEMKNVINNNEQNVKCLDLDPTSLNLLNFSNNQIGNSNQFLEEEEQDDDDDD